LRKYLLSLFTLSLLAACGEQSSDYPLPDLFPESVEAAAVTFLNEQEIDVTDYNLELLGFDYVKRTWRLSFVGESGFLHDTYWVVVADDDINEISLREN
jgi:hypothetical protein